VKYLALCLALVACEPVTRVAMNSVDGIPSESSCVPGSQACVPVADGGVYPATCSGRGRLWPNLPLTASGVQRVCVDAGCVVNDAGRAVCL
jgi:hypothetical protein